MKAILCPIELVNRLIEMRQGKNIPLGSDRIYVSEYLARAYAGEHPEIASSATRLILENASALIKDTGISPRGLGIIYTNLGGNVSDFPYKTLCNEFGYAA